MPSHTRIYWLKCVAIWLVITIAATIWLHDTRWWFLSLPSSILLLRAVWKWVMM